MTRIETPPATPTTIAGASCAGPSLPKWLCQLPACKLTLHANSEHILTPIRKHARQTATSCHDVHFVARIYDQTLAKFEDHAQDPFAVPLQTITAPPLGHAPRYHQQTAWKNKFGPHARWHRSNAPL